MAEHIPVFEFRGILTETLFAFLAREDLACVRLPDAWDSPKKDVPSPDS